MIAPPKTIDGAEVLKVAYTVPDAKGMTRHVVDGVELSQPAALALARYPDNHGIYLFYCDENWNALTDTYHDDIQKAIAQAVYEFGEVDFSDV